MTKFLDLEDLVSLVEDLGVGPVSDVGMVESAARRPQTRLYGSDVYASLDSKAAALLDSIVRNHALADGNKRLGWLAVVVFYGLNGVALDAPDDDAFDLVMAVASEHPDVDTIAERLANGHEPGAVVGE